MKGFPKHPDGALGPWYRKVNEAIAEAATCTEVTALIELLGEPDQTDSVDDVATPSQVMAELGSRFRFEDVGVERVLTWVDPYRPTRHYRFGLVGTRVTAHWIATVSG